MAGQIPQTFIDELLSRVDIVDIIDQRVTLKRSGANYSACCPFHNEKTPSFTVSQSKQFYHCFGCGANGNAIGFLIDYDNLHFVDAVETLADSIGLDVPRTSQASRANLESRPLLELMNAVAVFYQRELRRHTQAIDYLKGRGIDGETARQFVIGYSPDGWDGLQKQFPDAEKDLLKCGLLISGNSGKRPYQRFRNRIMFPIRDRRGRVIGFGGRVLDGQEPKYLNSPETPLFHKGRELYGLYEARKTAQDLQYMLVVEGYMDVIALARHGIHNVVATLGTAANQHHSDTLLKIVPTVVFCFDGDRAGRAAAWRALTATLPCLQNGRDAQFLFLPDGEDPDSVVSERGAAGFNDLLSERIPIIDFLYQHLAADIDINNIGGKARLAEKAKPLLASLPPGVYKQLAMQRLEHLIGLSLGSKSSAASVHVPRNTVKTDSGLTAMSRAVLLCLQQPAVVSRLSPDDFDISNSLPGSAVLLRLIAYCDADPAISTARLLERFRDCPEHAYLIKLATKSYWPDGRELDSETANTEFAYCIERLRKRSQQTQTEQVDKAFRGGLVG